jgi:hypothetical protein
MVMSPPRLRPLSDYTVNCRPVLSSERAPPQKQEHKFLTVTFREEVISGRKSHKVARYLDIMTD